MPTTSFLPPSLLCLFLPVISLVQAAYREETVLLLLIYKTHPRLTFCYLYLFHYYTMFLPIVQSQLQARDRFWPKAEEPHSLEDNSIPHAEVKSEIEGELELEMLKSTKKPVFVRTTCLHSLYTSTSYRSCRVQFIVRPR